MKKPFRTLQFICIATFFLYSCNYDGIINEENLIQNNESFNIEEARNYIMGIQVNNANNENSKNLSKSINSSFTKKAPDGLELYHVLNFEEAKGFVVMSANRNNFPILASSDSGNIPQQEENLPPGIDLWFSEAYHYLNTEGRKNKKNKALNNAWRKIDSFELLMEENNENKIQSFDEELPPPPEPPCEIYTIFQPPLLKTSWGQGCNYNLFTPEGTVSPCNRKLAGCIPVAMAQVINHWKFPLSNDFDYNLMDNEPSNPENAKLIAAIGKSVGAVYGNDYTFAIPQAITFAFVGLGYQNTIKRSSVTGWDISYNIRRGRPVLLEGRRNLVSDWHVWVADGYHAYTDECDGTGYQKLHMNWGWGRNSFNGWYMFFDWRPGNNDYTSDKRMIVDIQP